MPKPTPEAGHARAKKIPALLPRSATSAGIFLARSCRTSGPGLGNGAQRGQINFGVDGSAAFGLMAQNLRDLGHRGSVAEHLGSERMTKQGRSSVGWANSSALTSTLHHDVDGCGVGEALEGRR